MSDVDTMVHSSGRDAQPVYAGDTAGRDRLSVRRFRRAILRFAREHARHFPWRHSNDPYEVLIGEILLQRTRAENVVGTYSEFLLKWQTPDRLARSSPDEISACLRPLGLTKRGPMIYRLGLELKDLGRTPSVPEELLPLPCVGPYTASAVAVFAKGRNLPLVDRVIARVLRRYFGLPAVRRPDADAELIALATELVKPGRARELWSGVLDLAASVCKSRPSCSECPLRRNCLSATT